MTPKRLSPGLIDIPTGPTISIGQIKHRRFDLIRRTCPVCGVHSGSVREHLETMAETDPLHAVHQVMKT